ncbi:MAG: hypothetical protein IKP04_01050, partial [Candidatus Methanomethylophilaceae archaeon]|nr:hypothetical protein [Candidatus Methanomethylophilaceae archaeon]
MKSLNYQNKPLSPEALDRIGSAIGEGKISKSGEHVIITPATQADVAAAVKAVMEANGAITTKVAKH